MKRKSHQTIAVPPGSVTNLATVFGRCVASLRRELELNQIDFSNTHGISYDVIARIESGNSTATIDHIEPIAHAFMEEHLIRSWGDLMDIVMISVSRLQRENVRVIKGKLSKDSNIFSVKKIDLVVGVTVQELLQEWAQE